MENGKRIWIAMVVLCAVPGCCRIPGISLRSWPSDCSRATRPAGPAPGLWSLYPLWR